MKGGRESVFYQDDCLTPIRRQAIIWVNDDLDYWRIYASIGLHELNSSKDLKIRRRIR